MFFKKNLRTIFLSFFILAVLTVSVYILTRTSENGDTEIVKVTNKSLRETNTAFAAGLDAVNRENLAEADAYLTQAYDAEKDPRSKSIIALNDAIAFLRLSTTTDGKIYGVELAASFLDKDTIDKDMKAYAILALCQWYIATEDPELYKVIFDDSHFAAYVGQNKEESINNLYRYSLQYYKLSIPLLRTTRWDVSSILETVTISPEIKSAFLDSIPRALELVDADTNNVEVEGNSADLMVIYLERARLLASLENATGNQKFGDPALYFNKAYERAQLSNASLTKGYILLAASRYYLMKGDEKLMNNSLDLFAGDESIARSNMRKVISMLPTQKDASRVNMTKDLRTMAAQNANFKKSLLSMGFVL